MRLLTIMAVILSAGILAACETIPSKLDEAPEQTETTQQTEDQATQSDLVFMLAQLEEEQGLGELKLPDGTLWYLPRPVLTHNDLIKAEQMKADDGKPFIRFGLNPEATQRLATISERFPGKFLVVVLDHSLQSIYRIEDKIEDGVIDVPMTSSEQATKLLDSLPKD